jgi:2-octaprenyl-6-methoxyphenol hydroxylase
MESHEIPIFDVIIIGAGLVGNSLALSLADSAKIAIIESRPLAAPLLADERALALSFSSQRILSALNLWQTLQPFCTPIQKVHVSEVGHFGAVRFSAPDYGIAALGYAISAQTLTDTLQKSVLEKSSLRHFYATTLQQITPIPEGYRIQAITPEGTRTFITRLLVGADGTHSPTRKLLGIEASQQTPTQTAITARMAITHSHQNIAYQRFSKDAVLATLPITEKKVVVVWTVPTEFAKQLQTCIDQDFCHQFQAAFGNRLGKFTLAGKRLMYPLSSLHAAEQIRPHAVLLGNAAHTLHPVAAQGFNLSLRDVAVLAQMVIDAMAAGKNPGALSVLEHYLQQRKKGQLETIGFTQSIIKSFTKKDLPWALLKEAGLLGFAILPFAKNKAAHYATGIADQMPKWVINQPSQLP